MLLADTQYVWLNPNIPVELDVRQLLRSLDKAEQHRHRSWRTCALCEDCLREALDLYRGDFLADIAIIDSASFEEWVSQRREYIRQRALSALELLVERADQQHDLALQLTTGVWRFHQPGPPLPSRDPHRVGGGALLQKRCTRLQLHRVTP